jgi:hypothetical protein
MFPIDLFEGDIGLERSSLDTPVGEIRFVVSHRVWSVGGDEEELPHTQFSDFLAIAHHPATGVMTMNKARKETGGDARMACASAAQDLCLSIQAITAYIKNLEGPTP